MSNQLLIYRTAVPVSRTRHAEAAVQIGANYGFSRDVNSVPVMTVEFQHAASEYAIVFAGAQGQVMPAVILGLRNSENLFLQEDGGWHGRYVPAFLRRYPFVFSREGDRFVLCVDEDFPGFSRDGHGERLFAPGGEPSEYTSAVLKFMQDFQVQFQRTQAFCARLEELDLLEPMQAQVTEPSGARTSLQGFMVVSRDRVKALSPDTLGTMMEADHLELVYLHLQSLRNFDRLRERMVAVAKEAACRGPDPEAHPI